jgi:hypothetical protein
MTGWINLALRDFLLKWIRAGDFSNFSARSVGDTVNDVRPTMGVAVVESCIAHFMFDVSIFGLLMLYFS